MRETPLANLQTRWLHRQKRPEGQTTNGKGSLMQSASAIRDWRVFDSLTDEPPWSCTPRGLLDYEGVLQSHVYSISCRYRLPASHRSQQRAIRSTNDHHRQTPGAL